MPQELSAVMKKDIASETTATTSGPDAVNPELHASCVPKGVHQRQSSNTRKATTEKFNDSMADDGVSV